MKQFGGPAIFFNRNDINTDEIIPAKYLTEITKTALKPHLLEDLLLDGKAFDPAAAELQQANVVVTRANFGCGSSREHAVWALAEWGIRAIIAPGFGNIFYGNCVRNGILPVELDNAAVEDLAKQVEANPARNKIRIDLPACTVTAPSGAAHNFQIAPADQEMLLEGLDAIAVTMRRDDEILAFQARDRLKRPWIYGERRDS